MSELRRVLPLDRLGAGWTEFVVEADAAECAALAARLGVPAVLGLRCGFRLKAGRRGVVAAEGMLDAQLVRECVVTLEPFEVAVAEAFRVQFVPAERLAEAPEDAALDPDSDDEVGYEGQSLDLGEAAAEQLALGLDPYPRKPGVALAEDEEAGAGGAFAALARLRGAGSGG